jgi:hypothetical protein
VPMPAVATTLAIPTAHGTVLVRTTKGHACERTPGRRSTRKTSRYLRESVEGRGEGA